MKLTHEEVQKILNAKVKELAALPHVEERDWKQLMRDAEALRFKLQKLR
jgi:hypothetical protein